MGTTMSIWRPNAAQTSSTVIVPKHGDAGVGTSSAVMTRVMLPDDANPAGNVHGGTTMKMISEVNRIRESSSE